MLLNPFKLYSPKTLSEAIGLYCGRENTRLLAGGTFLINTLKSMKRKGSAAAPNIVSLRKINSLKNISLNNDTLTIGAMVTIDDLLNCPLLSENLSILRTVCQGVGTNPIRNMATVGGNLAGRYTWTELGTVFMALDARMNFVGADNKKEILSTEDFFRHQAKTDKILESVSLIKNKNQSLSYRRFTRSGKIDIPMLAVCLRLSFKGERLSDARAVINTGTTFAKRDIALEKFLNQANRRQAFDEALAHLDKSIYETSGDDYKKSMFKVCISESLGELLGRENQ